LNNTQYLAWFEERLLAEVRPILPSPATGHRVTAQRGVRSDGLPAGAQTLADRLDQLGRGHTAGSNQTTTLPLRG
jgi:hypothetical protein